MLEVPLVRKDGDIVSTLRDTLGWMNKELGGLWLFNRARKSLRKARAGRHPPLNPFSRLAPKSLSVLLSLFARSQAFPRSFL